MSVVLDYFTEEETDYSVILRCLFYDIFLYVAKILVLLHFLMKGRFRNQTVTTNKDMELLVNMETPYICCYLELLRFCCPKYQISTA
jgi:hypothetical protein